MNTLIEQKMKEFEELDLKMTETSMAGMTVDEPGIYHKGKLKAFLCKAMEKAMNTDKVTRFEVIDGTGRAYVKYDVQVKLDLQDDVRTLKVFVSQPNNENTNT